MALRFIGDLAGTLQEYYRVGLTGFRLKNSTGVAEVKNAGDTAYAQLNAHTVGLAGSNAANKVTLTAPAGLGGNVSFVLPAADGSAGQVLKTDGSGNLSFVAGVSNGELVNDTSFTEASSSPLSLFTPPANAVILRVLINVTSAGSAGSPTISVGVSGTAERDMAAAQVDLKTAGLYEVQPMTDVGGSPVEMIATITPSSQSFTGVIYVVYSQPA